MSSSQTRVSIKPSEVLEYQFTNISMACCDVQAKGQPRPHFLCLMSLMLLFRTNLPLLHHLQER